jgi:hypothetical protein
MLATAIPARSANTSALRATVLLLAYLQDMGDMPITVILPILGQCPPTLCMSAAACIADIVFTKGAFRRFFGYPGTAPIRPNPRPEM